MEKKITLIVGAALLVTMLAGCGPSIPDEIRVTVPPLLTVPPLIEIGTPFIPEEIRVTEPPIITVPPLIEIGTPVSPDLPLCPTDELLPPVLEEPPIESIDVGLDPIFEWRYPAPCNPEGYRIDVTAEVDFTEPITHSGGTGNPSTRWGVGVPLQPGTLYLWRVAAINGTTLGPYSDTSFFWTGPICAPDSFVAPVLLEPADASIVTAYDTLFAWDYSEDCTPWGFDFDTSTSPAFDEPGVSFAAPRFGPWPRKTWVEFADCTTYYWRVRATGAGGETGPFSTTWSFHTDLDGTCPAAAGRRSISIATIIRESLCWAGPGNKYDVVSSLQPGTEVTLLGMGDLPDWLVVDNPRYPGVACWVQEDRATIDPNLDLSSLKVFPVPPPPTATPVPAPAKPPTAPANLYIDKRVCNSKAYSVRLVWYDGAANETGYRVYRNGSVIATLGANASSYTDTPPYGGPYTYKVVAYNGAGPSTAASVQESGCLP